MPFRAKAKNLFKRKARGDSTSTNESSHDVYQPGEAMPPPKYRRAPQKEHRDKLEAFSFADAWRKRSFQSSHSPMGTRASSRRASFLSTGRKSVGRKSMTRASEDGGPSSFTGGETEERSSRQKDTVGGAIAPKLAPEPEQDGGDEVANVGITPSQSKDKTTTSPPRTAEGKQPTGLPNGLHKTRTTARDHQAFSEQDIASAMQRSQVQVPAQS